MLYRRESVSDLLIKGGCKFKSNTGEYKYWERETCTTIKKNIY